MMTELEHKRAARKKSTGEDFTPLALVSEMLDKLPPEVWHPEKLFCDPAGGSGNFVVEVLKRKLAKGHDPLSSLRTIFSVELMADNVEEMRDRLLIELPSLSPEEAKAARKIVNHNIVCHDALTFDFDNWCSTASKAKPLF